MRPIHCSVGILTFNSGKTLRRALESLKGCDDIILCDGGSTDDTLAIASEYGCRVIRQDPGFQYPDGRIKDYAGVRNQCLDAARYDWFLYIDSDESISSSLREDIARIVSEGTPSALAYRVPLGLIIDGKLIRHSSNYPGYQYRFFNRSTGARFVKTVHERVNIDTRRIRVDTLSSQWHTHTTKDYWRHFITHSSYYRPLEVALFRSASWSAYARFVLWRGIRTSLGVFTKATYNYAVYGFEDSMPVAGEFARFMVPLLLARDVFFEKLRASLRKVP